MTYAVGNVRTAEIGINDAGMATPRTARKGDVPSRTLTSRIAPRSSFSDSGAKSAPFLPGSLDVVPLGHELNGLPQLGFAGSTAEGKAQKSALRLKAGDALMSTGNWGTPVEISGVQLKTEVAAQPHHFARSDASGVMLEKTLASTMEVYVDDAVDVDLDDDDALAGPFGPDDIPLIARHGEKRLLVTGSSGARRIMLRPSYASPQLLPSGARNYSVQLGMEEGDFGEPVATATWAKGVSDRLTAELRSELAMEATTVGASAYWTSPVLGQFSGSLVQSLNGMQPGARLLFGYDYARSSFALGGRGEYGTNEYASVGFSGEHFDTAGPRRVLEAYAGYYPAGATSALISYLDINRAEGDIRILESSLIRSAGRLGYAFISCLQAIAPEPFTALQVKLVKPFGHKDKPKPKTESEALARQKEEALGVSPPDSD
jgi:outer membrane usher protein